VEYSAFPLTSEPFSWFSFLQVEADLAVTFIQSAKLYANPKDTDRALRNARNALSMIQRCLGNPAKYYLTKDEISLLEKLCAQITISLDARRPQPRGQNSLWPRAE
jgi:cob(I)alamin adenosyltransferase